MHQREARSACTQSFDKAGPDPVQPAPIFANLFLQYDLVGAQLLNKEPL